MWPVISKAWTIIIFVQAAPALFCSALLYCHRVIILNRGSMFSFQWREFSPPLSSAHRLFLPIDKRKIVDAAIPGERRIHASPSAPPPPQTRAISQWAGSLEWRHALTLHTAVGKNCITFFPFSCEACALYLVL